MITQPLQAPIHLRHYSVNQKNAGTEMTSGGQKIKFVNPNTDNYDRNIKYAGKLHKEGIPAYKKNSLPENTTAIIVGSGPSLNDPKVIEEVKKYKAEGAVIYACKQAIKYLHDLGISIDYGVTMDPGAHIARPEKIYKAPGMTHIVASSSDTLLFDYLLADKPFPEWFETLSEDNQKKILDYKDIPDEVTDIKDVPKQYANEYVQEDDKFVLKKKDDYKLWKAGQFELKDAGVNKADIMIFHSATGYKNEVLLYEKLFGTTKEDRENVSHYCCGGGYNVVNRAVSAAIHMGAKRIICAGTDCGWRPDENFYVDNTNNRPGVDMCDNGLVEGTDKEGNKIDNPNARAWMTRPDMLASGVALAKLANSHKEGQFIFLGDTLPSKLIHKSDKFLKQCANFGN